MTNFTKDVRVGTMQLYSKRWASIHVHIEYVDDRLSITGVIGALPSGNCLGSAGQIDRIFAHRSALDNNNQYVDLVTPSQIHFARGWSAEMWLDLLDVWARWHLNTLRGGDKHQESAKRALGITNETYTNICVELAKINLYDSDGYKYGTAWQREDVPNDILQFLSALPDADIPCAWDSMR